MNDEGMLIEKHSVEDLFDTLDRVEEQVMKTNGRVTEIEKIFSLKRGLST